MVAEPPRRSPHGRVYSKGRAGYACLHGKRVAIPSRTVCVGVSASRLRRYSMKSWMLFWVGSVWSKPWAGEGLWPWWPPATDHQHHGDHHALCPASGWGRRQQGMALQGSGARPTPDQASRGVVPGSRQQRHGAPHPGRRRHQDTAASPSRRWRPSAYDVMGRRRNRGGESTAAWRQCIEDLDARGLRQPDLVIIDGSPDLEAALTALWGEDRPMQRCTVHNTEPVGSCSQAPAWGTQRRLQRHDRCP